MAKFNYKKLKESIDKKCFYGLYFLTGESYFVDSFEKKIVENILGSQKNDFNFFVFCGSEIDIEKLEINVNTFPVGSSKKCIVLRGLPVSDWNENDIKSFTELIMDIPDFTTLIICQTNKESGIKSSNKIKKIQKTSEEIGCAAEILMKDINIEKWIIAEANRKFGKTLSVSLAEKLRKECEAHTAEQFINELRKICAFEKSNEITEKSLDVVCNSKENKKIFDLPKAILAGNKKRALDLLQQLLIQGEEPISIVSIIGSEYIDMFRVKTFIENGDNPMELAKIFDYKSKEFRIKNAQRNCQKRSMCAIKRCLKLISDADLKLKSTSIDKTLVLSELIVKLI